MTGEQKREYRVHWPEVGLPPDAEEREEFEEYMSNPLYRRLMYLARLVSTTFEIVITTILAAAVFVAVYLGDVVTSTEPVAMFWVAIAAALAITAIDVMVSWAYFSLIAYASGAITYAFLMAGFHLYVWYKHSRGRPNIVNGKRFAQWLQIPPILYSNRFRNDGWDLF